MFLVHRAARRAQAAAGALVVHQGNKALLPTATGGRKEYMPSAQLAKRLPSAWPRPVWHAPWKMYRVVSGHLGCAPAACFCDSCHSCPLNSVPLTEDVYTGCSTFILGCL